MSKRFTFKQESPSYIELHFHITEPEQLSDAEEIMNDVLGIKEDFSVAEEIGRQEYAGKLEQMTTNSFNNDEIILSHSCEYCKKDESNTRDALNYPQQKGKIIQWWSIITTRNHGEVKCTAEFYVLYRDIRGNLYRLLTRDNTMPLTVTPRAKEDLATVMYISREDGKPIDCGRYYFVQCFRRKDDSLIGPPAITYLNILPPKGRIEPEQAHLVGMEAIYRQMASLVKQKMFNDNRNALRLPSTPLNLNAAVMGGKGSGKTSFAHILFDYYKENGLISDGKLQIVDARRWVRLSEDVSPVEEDMSAAKDGMLYIENAASMVPFDFKGNKEYIVQALVRLMQDNRDNVAVVLADTPEALSGLLAAEGLRSCIGQIYQLPTLDLDQMMEVAFRECRRRGFDLSDGAATAMRSVLCSRPDATSKDVVELLDAMIIRMSERVMNGTQELFQTREELTQLLSEDVPMPHINRFDSSMGKLNALVGLKSLKYNIESHLNLVRFTQLRQRNGLKAAMPPLHMIFTGNPGTGKTTVANLLGEIYASLGILKTGKVIPVDRKKLVGQFIGDTEENTKRALRQAHGNILFVDEAYTLVGDPEDKKDYGPKVLECMLEELGRETNDMIIILAGYPDEMETLLKSNKGLRSRFPYTFHFEDYTEDELIEIAVSTAEKCKYTFSDEALARLRVLIRNEREKSRNSSDESKHFGNARFVTRLISNCIIPNMSRRVLSMSAQDTSVQTLSCITAEDVPQKVELFPNTPDELLISRTLAQLDEMVGLYDVKKTLHNLVAVARNKQQSEEDLVETIPLQWTFTGATGTGKSSVAKLLAQLLHAFHLITSDHMTQIRMPQSNAWTAYEVDNILRDTMKQSGRGLLFIDLDDVANSRIDVRWLRCKLTSLTAEMPGSYAFVIAVDDKRAAEAAIDMPISTSVIHFDNYSEGELMDILLQRLHKHDFVLTDSAQQAVAEHIHSLCDKRNCGFANARTIKHIYTAITSAAAIRLERSGQNDAVVEITADDVLSFTWKPVQSNRIGYSA